MVSLGSQSIKRIKSFSLMLKLACFGPLFMELTIYSCVYVQMSKKHLVTNSFLFPVIFKSIENNRTRLTRALDFTPMFEAYMVEADVVGPLFIKALEVSDENDLSTNITCLIAPAAERPLGR